MNKLQKFLYNIRKSSYKDQIHMYNYAYPELVCPTCGTICRLDQIDLRIPQDICLDENRYLLILVGIYRCIHCRNNGLKHCFRSQPDQVEYRRRYTRRAIEKTVDRVKIDKQSYQGASSSVRRDFHTSTVPSTAWRWVNQYDEKSLYEIKDRSYFSGILSIDEFYPSGKCVVSIIDDQTKEVIVQEELEAIDKKEIIILMEKSKNILANFNIDVKQVNTDGSPLYTNSVSEVFGEDKHQRCVFHILKEVGRQYIKKIKKNNKFEAPLNTSLKGFQLKIRYMILKMEWDLNELQFWEKVCELNPILNDFQYIWFLFASIWEANSNEEGKYRWKNLLDLLKNGNYPNEMEVIRKCLLDSDTMEKSLTYLRIGSGSKTSNSVERLHRKYRKIEKIHYGLRSAITRIKRYRLI